ncbi:hypothetical protein F183_A24310 [Bryobacterales bacterium F-183]|nr:hypothetical protein F183_A24310 [Bryobacterales bacterium F-183]
MLRLYESGSALMSFVAETDGVLEDGVMQPLEQATETHAVALLMSARRPERVDAPKQTPDGTYQVNAATLMRHANSRIRPRALPGSPRFELVRIEVDERGGVRRVSCVQKQCEFLPLLEEEIRAITFRPFEVQGIAVSVRAELPIGVGPEGTMLTPLAAN